MASWLCDNWWLKVRYKLYKQQRDFVLIYSWIQKVEELFDWILAIITQFKRRQFLESIRWRGAVKDVELVIDDESLLKK